MSDDPHLEQLKRMLSETRGEIRQRRGGNGGTPAHTITLDDLLAAESKLELLIEEHLERLRASEEGQADTGE